MSIAVVVAAAASAGAQDGARVVTDGTLGYTTIPIRETGVRFPRLTRYRDAAVMRRVNREIDTFTADIGCEENGRESYFNVRSRVTYAASEILSIYATQEYYCGTAYPTNDANSSMTFDMRTGKRVEFEALFSNYARDVRRILRVIFAAQVATSERLAGKSARGDDCDTDPELYSLAHLESGSFAFHLGADGLTVQPEWPHVIEACAELVTVPYARVRQFAAPGGVLARAAAAAAAASRSSTRRAPPPRKTR